MKITRESLMTLETYAKERPQFGRPVLLLEGDSHVLTVDRPSGMPENLIRIVVQGSTSVPHEWLRLHVDSKSAGVFSCEIVFGALGAVEELVDPVESRGLACGVLLHAQRPLRGRFGPAGNRAAGRTSRTPRRGAPSAGSRRYSRGGSRSIRCRRAYRPAGP